MRRFLHSRSANLVNEQIARQGRRRAWTLRFSWRRPTAGDCWAGRGQNALKMAIGFSIASTKDPRTCPPKAWFRARTTLPAEIVVGQIWRSQAELAKAAAERRFLTDRLSSAGKAFAALDTMCERLLMPSSQRPPSSQPAVHPEPAAKPSFVRLKIARLQRLRLSTLGTHWLRKGTAVLNAYPLWIDLCGLFMTRTSTAHVQERQRNRNNQSTQRSCAKMGSDLAYGINRPQGRPLILLSRVRLSRQFRGEMALRLAESVGFPAKEPNEALERRRSRASLKKGSRNDGHWA